MKTIIEMLTGNPCTIREAFQKLQKPSRLYLDVLDPQPSSCVVLAGSHRSGTSWIAEVLTSDDRFRYMWEPFHLRFVPDMKRFARLPRIYLRPDAEARAFYEYARRVLSGRVRLQRIDRYNTSRLPRGRLIKDCHANLFLKWLRVQFPEPPMLFLMRHPCAVAHSARSLDFHKYHLGDHDEYFEQLELMADHLEPFRELIKNTTETFDRFVLLWCVENYVPLRQLRRGDALILFYELLCVAPQAYVKPIFDWTGRPYTEEVLKRLQVPSQTAWGDHSGMKPGRNPTSYWWDDVTAAERGRALELLRAFGLDAIYNDEVMPTPDGLDRFLAPADVSRDCVLSRNPDGKT